MDLKSVFIEDRLEAIMQINPASEWIAVLSHPHSKLGGDLNNNMVVSCEQALRKENFSTLRFNLRGVGSSKGWSTWTFVNEREDIKAVLNYAKTLKKKVLLIAYSASAACSCSVINEIKESIDALVVIGYPKGFLSWFIFHSHYKFKENKEKNIPKLILLGNHDDFTTVSSMRAMFETQFTEPKEMKVVEGDHFFFNHEHLIYNEIIDWIKRSNL